MFRLSRKVFDTILEVLSPFLSDGMSRNHHKTYQQVLKLGVALYCFAHSGDSFHLEAASGLSKPTALKYVHLKYVEAQKPNNGTILCTAQLDFLLRRYMVDGRTDSVDLYMA